MQGVPMVASETESSTDAGHTQTWLPYHNRGIDAMQCGGVDVALAQLQPYGGRP
jgi:hypothetical protein